MEYVLTVDNITVTARHGLGFAKILLSRHEENSMKLEFPSSPSVGTLTITAGISSVDAISAPPIRSHSYRAVPRILGRRIRRARRKSLTGGSDSDAGDDGFSGDDGPFGGGSGGRGWNFGRYGESSWNWEGESHSSYKDPAFDFVYEVLCWIALSNCVHFAFKKIIRIVGDGVGDPSREKVAMPFVQC